MKRVVFLGPSLPRLAAIGILPDAVYLPPARQADVLSAVETYQPDVLALVDGSFGQSLSVWHKEILFALERGVRVYGAASLGALRAVELASFGMLGVGEVYRLFASGELQDDDEVALVHADAADDFRPLSEPMVNLRATFALASTEGLLTSSECALLIATAKQHHFRDRTFPRILSAAVAEGLNTFTAERLSSLVATHYVDVKARDAEQLLALIRDLPRPVAPPARKRRRSEAGTVGPSERSDAGAAAWSERSDAGAAFAFERSASFETLYENERCVRQAGIDVPLRAVANYAALHHPGFDDLNFAALNTALVMVLADLLHVEPTPSDIEVETRRFRVRRGLETDSALSAWLAAQHLTVEAFQVLLEELATARRLQRWLLVRDRGTRRTRWLLDELRLRGEFVDMATAAAEQHAVAESWEPASHLAGLPEDAVVLGPLVAAHRQATDWRVDVPLATWAEEAGFESAQDLALELLRAARVRERLRSAARALVGGGFSPGPNSSIDLAQQVHDVVAPPQAIDHGALDPIDVGHTVE